MSVWQPEQLASDECCLYSSRVVVATVGAFNIVFTSAGGGGSTSHSSRVRTSLPRCTGELRCGPACPASTLPCPRMPRARCVGEYDTLVRVVPFTPLIP